ncbi:IclR family transcriptional regulator [Pseudohalocynthiibacter sp. F2068]|jgi:DNA-binding IclR family transcriptional regulator|uniref:IclR family transcriptional regulator n=1 Tax=Pseudohalocynthiibacter sp. F2068 TaxID=2926418 RepID=UPI001FF237C8|nr:IclR family transcriptional regulator [Pseudohalocynthiibacter sp. F2068]MCK0100720.1 IclR family transcriptional regulator [Pseudohalocynthiibacter sp. F2068]
MPEDSSETSGNIPTNLRLLLVLEQMASVGASATPTDVNLVLGLPKPTIHRLFTTLENEGFIQREIDGRRFLPGLRLRTLSAGVLSSLRVRTARIAILTRLAEQIGETCNIALPERDSMIYIDRVETKWPLRIQLPIGTRVPFYCTASGKLYLSSLSSTLLNQYAQAAEFTSFTSQTHRTSDSLIKEIRKIRKNGFATDNEEFMEGMVAVGVPILDKNNRLVSTLSFHAPVQRLTMHDALNHLDALRNAAKSLSALIS